ncbi:MAG: gliding motility-associated C-terminal domain-containing protein [Bacteroidales bacterium]
MQRGIYRYMSIIFLTVLLVQQTRAQRPDVPIIRKISVINAEGHVALSWELTDSATVIIYRDSMNINAHIRLDSIRDTSQHTYIDRTANANQRSRSYRLAAYDSTPGLAYDISNKTDEFHTLFATAQYDTCDNEATISATQYINNFMDTGDVAMTRYFVASLDEAGNHQIIAESDTPEFQLSNLNNNEAYSLQVGGLPDLTTADTTWSNMLSLFTNRKRPPDFIHPALCSVTGNEVSLGFAIDDASELDTYWLLKQQANSTDFDTLTKNSGIDNYFSYTDAYNNTAAVYKLIAVNSCLQPSTESESVSTIQLTAQQTGEWTYSLKWNEATDAEQMYTLWRKIGDADFQELISATPITEHNEDLQNLPAEDRTQTICYQVSTTLEPGGAQKSYSTQLCLDISPEVKIPNAFTPNGDGHNDTFAPLFSFIAKRYQLTIVDRYGKVLFMSRTPGERWTGTDARGNPLAEGTYIYFLEITTNTGQIIEKSGNITLLYP